MIEIYSPKKGMMLFFKEPKTAIYKPILLKSLLQLIIRKSKITTRHEAKVSKMKNLLDYAISYAEKAWFQYEASEMELYNLIIDLYKEMGEIGRFLYG